MGWIDTARASADAKSTALALMQERIDTSATLQNLFAQQRTFRAAHPGGVWSLITNDNLRAEWLTISRQFPAALSGAGVTIPEGYSFDFSGSGQLVPEPGGFNWLLAVGVLAAPLAVAFLPGLIAGAGSAPAAATGAVLPSSSIPLASSAVVPTIVSQGASAAVYGSTAAAVGTAATVGTAVATAGATGGAAPILKAVSGIAPKIAAMFAPRPDPVETQIPGYISEGWTAPRGVDALLRDPLVLAGLAGVVILAVVLARK